MQICAPLYNPCVWLYQMQAHKGFILPDHKVDDSLKCPRHVSHPCLHFPSAQVLIVTQQCV